MLDAFKRDLAKRVEHIEAAVEHGFYRKVEGHVLHGIAQVQGPQLELGPVKEDGDASHGDAVNDRLASSIIAGWLQRENRPPIRAERVRQL